MRASLETHLSSRQVSRIVYGAIIGLALVVGADKQPPGAGVMTGWLVTSAVAVALAELYSEVVGAETRERHRVTRQQFVPMLHNAAAVGVGVGFPAVFFLLAVVHLIEVDTAFAIAKWGGLGLIGFYGFWAARFAGTPVLRALVQAVLVAAVGASLIAFKALVH